MPGGARPGAGRKAGGKNKATLERELLAAKATIRQAKEGRELAKDVLERLMLDLDRFKSLAEGAAALHKPPTAGELKAAAERGLSLAKGDWGLFGEWFDRAVGTARDAATVAKDLAKYQSPQIRAVDAPAPPPDPEKLREGSTRRFGLRVFEGGKPLTAA
jgi:hypothetical protein